ncbi:MAG: class V aminotransferase [Pseudomonadota bacterium]|nr:class V aminotransferase [Pseudomonadota bacterium]
MSFKRLFSRALAAERLHLAAHSHHPWPDVSREAQIEAWDDAARLLDGKWDRIMGEVWPRAQAEVAAELGLPSPDTVVFAPNTHQLLVSLASAVERRPVRILTTDGEFHSARRQFKRWAEAGDAVVEWVATEPFEDFPARFRARAERGGYDLIAASHVFFGSGRVFEEVFDLAALAAPAGPWLLIDAYHGFMATPTDLGPLADRVFYTAGGYKYAMSGEGVAFLHAPPGFGARPGVTGWYAEFGELTGPPGGVGYASDATRFFGATFDPSGLYRFNAVRAMLDREGLTTSAISDHVEALKGQVIEMAASGAAGRLGRAELLNPPRAGRAAARFLAFRHPEAPRWHAALEEGGVITDVRRDVLRVGLGIYHDAADLDRFAAVCRERL